VSAGTEPALIVIVAYCCRDLLRDSLESIDVNREDVELAVEVSDNASNDDTIGAARDVEWVRATALDDNVGCARANNLGFARARVGNLRPGPGHARAPAWSAPLS
jgi:GT2 family glycosyltransferase